MRRLIVLAVVGGGLLLATPPASAAQSDCTPAKKVWSEKNWRAANPARGVEICDTKTRTGLRNTKAHFGLYRHYRGITPFRCHGGSEGTYAIPCYIIACESRFSWSAYNPSGALGIYQLLGWGAPFPANTFRKRVAHHRIAAGLSLSNWVCA